MHSPTYLHLVCHRCSACVTAKQGAGDAGSEFDVHDNNLSDLKHHLKPLIIQAVVAALQPPGEGEAPHPPGEPIESRMRAKLDACGEPWHAPLQIDSPRWGGPAGHAHVQLAAAHAF